MPGARRVSHAACSTGDLAVADRRRAGQRLRRRERRRAASSRREYGDKIGKTYGGQRSRRRLGRRRRRRGRSSRPQGALQRRHHGGRRRDRRRRGARHRRARIIISKGVFYIPEAGRRARRAARRASRRCSPTFRSRVCATSTTVKEHIRSASPKRFTRARNAARHHSRRHGGMRRSRMTAVFLGLLAATFYGAADFLRRFGDASARPCSAVTAASQLDRAACSSRSRFGSPGRPTPVDLLWGLAAGVCGGAGIALALSRALDRQDGRRFADDCGDRGRSSRSPSASRAANGRAYGSAWDSRSR